MTESKQHRSLPAAVYINNSSETLNPQALLLNSLDKLYAELDEFSKVADKYFIEKIKKLESVSG